MFWGAFWYDYKGSCHCWKPETAKEKKISEDLIKDLNKRLEPAKRQEWGLTKGISCLSLQGISGPKPVWKFNKATGAYFRKQASKGIDWWRYRTVILEPLLIPFTK